MRKSGRLVEVTSTIILNRIPRLAAQLQDVRSQLKDLRDLLNVAEKPEAGLVAAELERVNEAVAAGDLAQDNSGLSRISIIAERLGIASAGIVSIFQAIQAISGR